MNWEIIGAAGEVFGAFAVVASLIFVGRQFRHSSTYALENIYFQTVTNFSSSPENAKVIAKGNSDYYSLSEQERQHYVMMIHNMLSAMEAIYLQNKRGLINKESTERVLQVAYFYLSQPGFVVIWESVLKEYLHPSFVAALQKGEMKRIVSTDITLGTKTDDNEIQ